MDFFRYCSNFLCALYRAELANALYDILVKQRESYIEKNPEEEATSNRGRDCSAGEGSAAVGLRPGYTYTITSSGVVRQSGHPVHPYANGGLEASDSQSASNDIHSANTELNLDRGDDGATGEGH